MGILEGIEKTLSTVSRATGAADRAINEANKAKRIKDTVGNALAKKCKFCSAVLKSDAEKKKGVCANCALQRM